MVYGLGNSRAVPDTKLSLGLTSAREHNVKISALVIGAVALAGSALALPTTTDAASKVAGYLDPSNGVFSPVASNAGQGAAVAAALTRSGVITVVINLAIQSAIPTGQEISCSANIGTNEFPGISNSASASTALIKTGTTGKCTMAIPYQWIVASASTQVSVSANVNVQATGGAVTSRSANGTFPAFPIQGGGNKTITVNVAI